MPRQGVPYPSREICSLKCQIDALQRQINELMKSINGVEGDGQGNVSLISGDPAIVISSDQAQHEIEIALDSSQLPAAAVSSVNSQTGAVQLEADDIPSDGNSDVQADIDALKALGVNLQGAINNEVTARGNADAALQGNINTVSAGIPAAAAAAVAADPTVAQLAVDVPNKLDKITSGNSLKAYTHTGATQGEKSVVDGTTADSIAIRDANGRLQAADPASGATDKTLVTSNWVSQTGDSAPNNLIHKSGNETKTGILTLSSKNTIIIGQPHGAPEEGQLIVKDYRTDAAHTIGDPTQISFNFGRLIFLDGNGNYGASIVFTNNAGVSTCELWLRNANGTRKTVILGSGNP